MDYKDRVIEYINGQNRFSRVLPISFGDIYQEQFEIDSAAASREEIGNPPHHGTVAKLRAEGVPVVPHRARQMTKEDYKKYDYLIGMDGVNIRNMNRIAGGDLAGCERRTGLIFGTEHALEFSPETARVWDKEIRIRR